MPIRHHISEESVQPPLSFTFDVIALDGCNKVQTLAAFAWGDTLISFWFEDVNHRSVFEEPIRTGKASSNLFVECLTN